MPDNWVFAESRVKARTSNTQHRPSNIERKVLASLDVGHRLALSRTSHRPVYDPCLHIVLYQPEIPHNTGSVGRTCVAVGAKLWLVGPLGFRTDDYYLRRAGLDYWRHLLWEVVDDWPTLLERLPKREPWFFTKTAERPYTTVRYEPADILVFGNESAGLPPAILDAYPSRRLRIPARPQVRSLNLSNAVAVAAYEAQRQWA